MAGYPQIVGTNRCACFFELGELDGVVFAQGFVGRALHGDVANQVAKLAQHFGFASAALGAFEQFGKGKKRHAQLRVLAQGVDALRDRWGLFLIR